MKSFHTNKISLSLHLVNHCSVLVGTTPRRKNSHHRRQARPKMSLKNSTPAISIAWHAATVLRSPSNK
ncbi:hypothetical protein SAMN05660860_00605 [Geoalkalibacter ferrihydriticus]|uniref:Uncharacterized protein n=1 Tax=Geoalkalibacter ferrihydriticus TaxID=392333 RepID=A0A1G9K019_9BACT|nr:hypothetical protein SAMN05660860_00605 [Geoalkalibacter ferrihydriticus]